MSDLDNDPIGAAFTDFRRRQTPMIKPAGLPPVRATVRRRRRNRIQLAAVAAGVAAVLVAVVALRGPSTGPQPTVGPSPSPSGSLPYSRIAAAMSRLEWVIAVDATHLYAQETACTDDGESSSPQASSSPAHGVTIPITCVRQLLASTDAGHTWSIRQRDIRLSYPTLAGTGTMVAWQSPEQMGPQSTLAASTDGGRHWRKITLATTAVGSLPRGGFAICVSSGGADVPCVVFAVDPAHLVASPLAVQPPIRAVGDIMTPEPLSQAGTIWTIGTSHTGSNPHAIAVAVSLDSGRTWQANQFGTCPGPGRLWSSGATAKVLCQDGPTTTSLYRTDDHGRSWRQVPLPQPLPFFSDGNEAALRFLADGTVLGEMSPRDGSALRMWLLRDDAPTWQRLQPVGLAPAAQTIRHSPDGSYFATRGGGGNLDAYRSTDLKTWTHLVVK